MCVCLSARTQVPALLPESKLDGIGLTFTVDEKQDESRQGGQAKIYRVYSVAGYDAQGQPIDEIDYAAKVQAYIDAANANQQTSDAIVAAALAADNAGEDVDFAKMTADLKAAADKLEKVVSSKLWPLPTYRQMLFVK